MSGIAVVTGASRGLGRGIARAIGAGGWTVYVTGRTVEALGQAVAEIDALGGRGIAVACDHADDAQVAALFARIGAEQDGIDILVNNAAAVYGQELVREGPFWEKDLALADMITVGLRSNYVAAYYAAPLMIGRAGSLVVNISFFGAVSYFHGPAYGAAKAGTDKMTYDMSVDFAATQTSVVSLWPGYILTDEIRAIPPEHFIPDLVPLLPEFETPEFSGKVIMALHADPSKKELSGQALIAAEAARRYGVKDEGGNEAGGRDRRNWSDLLGVPVPYPYGVGGKA